MKTFEEAIEERRSLVQQLELEIEQLESSRSMLGVGVEKTENGRWPRTIAPADRFPCGHRRIDENTYVKTNPTGDPVAHCATCQKRRSKEQTQRKRAARTEAEPAAAPAEPAPKAAPFAAAAAKWKTTCQVVDFDSGRRCTLPAPHALPHSASGRTFNKGLSPGDLPDRPLDHEATRGASDA